MALYSYQAYSKDGKKVKGVLDAPSQSAVKDQLTKQGLYPINITLAKKEARLGFVARLFQRKVSVKQKILFTKQLAVLLKSGVPLLQALELLVEQFEGRLRSIIVAVKDEVKEGSSLADALSKYPTVFENIYVQLVRAGEASGKLEVILERLVEYMERSEALRKRIKVALQYPMIQLVVALGVVVILLTTVVPKIVGVFAAQNIELPGTTQFLLSLSSFITNHYIILLIVLAALIAAFRYWKNTPSGALTLDKIKLKIPVLKFLSRTTAVVQFCYTLGMLLQAGVNLPEALDIVVSIIDNKVLADSLSKARDKIVKQGKIAQYLKQSGVFPNIAIYLIQTGEESGQLDQMLLTVALNYEEEAKELTDRLTGLLGPIMLLVMGLIVGLIVISVMGPMMQMMNSIRF